VTKKESGSSTVLGCRYHGWSYDTRGKLIKAPEFDSVAGFNKELNGLWELKTQVQEGLLFVNLHVGDGEVDLELGNTLIELKKWKICDMKWVHESKLEGEFNWKLAGEFFGSFDWMDFADEFEAESTFKLSRKIEFSNVKWFISFMFVVRQDTLSPSLTSCVHRLPSGSLLTLKFLPLSPIRTSIEFNLYRTTSRYSRSTQLELDTIKEKVQMMVEQTESQQRNLVEGTGEISNRESLMGKCQTEWLN